MKDMHGQAASPRLEPKMRNGRGLKPVGTVQLGKEKKVVIVYLWEATAADAAAKVGNQLNVPPADPKGGAKPAPKKPAPKIPDRKIIIID